MIADDVGANEARSAIAALEVLRQRKAALEREITEQGERAVRGLRRHTAEREQADQAPDRGLINFLYWWGPEVKVAGMKDALGLRASAEVVKLAGEGRVFESCHGGCGREVAWTASSRNEMVLSNRLTRMPDGHVAPGDQRRYCEDCWNERVEALNRSVEASQRHTQIREQRRAELIASGLQPTRETAVFYMDPETGEKL